MYAQERHIGYTGKEAGHEAAIAKKMDRILLETDKGLQISLQDALCNTLGTGTTGCGKTESLGLPCANSLISFGLAGLFTASKLNFGMKIRSLALAHGRHDAIVEIGTGPWAMPINLIADMDMEKLRQFLEDMVSTHTQKNKENWIWLLKGIHQGAHCGQLLKFISPAFPEFCPTLSLISQLLNNQALTAELYAYFLNNIYNPDISEHVFFRSAVDSQAFHIMRKPSEKGSMKSITSEEEQNTWNLQGIRMTLQQFLTTPGMERNFCDPKAPALDMKAILENNQMALVQFEMASGPAGDMLTRHALSEWYGAILDAGPVVPGKIRAFTLLDEFQQIADLGEGRLSDFRFTSLSREYGVVNVLLTQSEAALHVNCPNTYRVSGFTTNFNQRFFAYSNDPITKTSASEFDPSIHLQDLEPTKMFVAHYDQNLRRHVNGIDSLNKAYAETRDLIEANPAPEAPVRPQSVPQKDLTKLIRLVRQEVEKIKAQKQKAEQARKEAEKAKNTQTQKENSNRRPTIRIETSFSSKKEGKMDKDSDTIGIFDTVDVFSDKKPEKREEKNPFSLKLEERFPEFFPEGVKANVPAGWQDYVEKALTLFESTGLRLQIKGINLHEGGLRVATIRDKTYSEMGGNSIEVFESLLEQAKNLCMVCGKLLPATPNLSRSSKISWINDDDDDDNEDHGNDAVNLPVCHDCLNRSGLGGYFFPDPACEKNSKNA